MCQHRSTSAPSSSSSACSGDCGDGGSAPTCSCGGRKAHTAGHTLRAARPADVPLLLGLVRELALYESLVHEFEATADLFQQHLFGPTPKAFALLAYAGDQPAGLALWFPTYSTFSGRPGAFVEDLYVRPPFRRNGVGRDLLQAVAQQARAMGCVRLEWRTLKWNESALGFYRSLGAEPLSEWLTLRLNEPALGKL